MDATRTKLLNINIITCSKDEIWSPFLLKLISISENHSSMIIDNKIPLWELCCYCELTCVACRNNTEQYHNIYVIIYE